MEMKIVKFWNRCDKRDLPDGWETAHRNGKIKDVL